MRLWKEPSSELPVSFSSNLETNLLRKIVLSRFHCGQEFTISTARLTVSRWLDAVLFFSGILVGAFVMFVTCQHIYHVFVLLQQLIFSFNVTVWEHRHPRWSASPFWEYCASIRAFPLD